MSLAAQGPPEVLPPQVLSPQTPASPSTLTAPAAVPGNEDQVVDVRIVGNRNVPLSKIAPQVRTRAGRPFDLQVVQEDVRRLNQTKMFVTVKTFHRRVPEGVVVIFEVLERPMLHYVKYIGNSKISTKNIRKQADIKAGDALDPFAVEEARRKIENHYHEKGFSKARVTIIEGNRAEDQGAIFLINEGQKQRILWTNFVGNTIADDARLRTQIESKPGFLWIFKGEVDRKKIDEDINRLTAYYRGLGFFRAHVGRELQFNEKQNWLTLTFVVDEGPRHRVRNLSVIGNTKFTTAELTEKIKLKSGDYFNQMHMNADLVRFQDRYGGIGYVFADIKADPRILEEPGTLDLVYTISEGDRYRVGRVNVEIRGDSPRTRITTVLNRLSLRPGDIVDTRELRASERRLQLSGLFLTDPANGVKPKIVFSPPDKETEVARDPKRPGYRGQSPDDNAPPPPAAVPTVLPPGERVVDLTLDAQWAPGPWVEEESLPKASRGPDRPQATASVDPPPQVVRYQYTGDSGREIPSIRPRIQSNGATGPTFPSPAATPVAPQPSAAPMYQPPAAAPNPYSTPAPGYAAPTPNYSTPAPGYSAPAPGYSTPAPGYSTPAPGYSTPAPGYSTPAPGYSAPAPGYSTPAPGYAAPAPGYSTPTPGPAIPPGYAAPAPNYSAPVPGYAAPAPSYATPPGQFAPPGAGIPPAAPPETIAPPAGVPGVPGPFAAPSGAAPATPPAFLAPNVPGGMGGPPAPGQLAPGGEPLFPEGPAFTRPGERDWTRPLDLSAEVKETETGRLMFGVGVNSDAGLMGSFIIDERNFDWTRFPRSWEDIRSGQAFRGAGQRFRFEAVPGTQLQRYVINFGEPYLFDTDVSLGLSGYYFDRQYYEWTEQRVGGKVTLGYQFTHDLSGTVGFRGERITVMNPIDPTLDAFQGVLGHPNALYGFSASLAHDTRDSSFLATEGHLFEFSFEQVIGTFQYPRYEVDLRQHFTLFQRPDGSGRHVLSLLGRFGVVGDNTPIYDRYFAGGFSTIRGFRFRGASPRERGVAVGGDAMVLTSAEYLFPITADDMLRGVFFCDAGAVQPSLSNWRDAFRVAPGFGLRITIPALGPAPIALDVAFPVASEPGDRIENFSFFIGIGK